MGTVKDKVPLPVTEYDYYEVFAREEMDGPLAHIGCLSAPNRETALAQARLMYSEKIWVEMCMFRRDDVIPIISPNDVLGAA
jgi:1,2-phenylacetyl-CoA epoxidase PaaB subunit